MILDQELAKQLEEKTVYVVTNGQYSDYSISSIFSTKEKAEQFINSRKDYDIEPFILDNDTGKGIHFTCYFDKEGNSFIKENEVSYIDDDKEIYWNYHPIEQLKASSNADQTQKAGYYWFTLIARSKEQAYHVIGDVHTEILLNHKWGETIQYEKNAN